MHRTRPTRSAAVAITLLLALGACSSSGGADDKAEGTTTTTASTSTSVTGEPADETTTTEDGTTTTEASDLPPGIDEAEADDARDRVERVNLTIDDLPEGWEAEDAEDDSSTMFDECSELDVDEHLVAKASSDQFSLSQDAGQLGLSSGTGYLDTEDVAVALMAELSTDEFARCASEELEAGADIEIDGEFQTSSGLPELADEATALTGDFTLTDPSSGQTVHLSAIIVAIRTDQVVTTVSATAIDTPGDEPLLYQLLDLVAERQET